MAKKRRVVVSSDDDAVGTAAGGKRRASAPSSEEEAVDAVAIAVAVDTVIGGEGGPIPVGAGDRQARSESVAVSTVAPLAVAEALAVSELGSSRTVGGGVAGSLGTVGGDELATDPFAGSSGAAQAEVADQGQDAFDLLCEESQAEALAREQESQDAFDLLCQESQAQLLLAREQGRDEMEEVERIRQEAQEEFDRRAAENQPPPPPVEAPDAFDAAVRQAAFDHFEEIGRRFLASMGQAPVPRPLGFPNLQLERELFGSSSASSSDSADSAMGS
jgi:hypothetical protein